jgi:hypothetical protein
MARRSGVERRKGNLVKKHSTRDNVEQELVKGKRRRREAGKARNGKWE